MEKCVVDSWSRCAYVCICIVGSLISLEIFWTILRKYVVGMQIDSYAETNVACAVPRSKISKDWYLNPLGAAICDAFPQEHLVDWLIFPRCQAIGNFPPHGYESSVIIYLQQGVCSMVKSWIFKWLGPLLTLHWLVVWNINFIFPYIGNNHPNWLSYFSEGWPNQPVHVWNRCTR